MTPMTQRSDAIDTLRGIGILGMIMVSYNQLAPPLLTAMQSSSYLGSKAVDLILPLFLFCVGASMGYSFNQYKETLSLFRKILIRSGAFILIGVGITLFHLYTDSTAHLEKNYVEQFADYVAIAHPYNPLIRIGLCILFGGTIIAFVRNYALLLLIILPLGVLHIYSLVWLIDAQLINFSDAKELVLSHVEHRDTIAIHDYSHAKYYLEALSILPATIPLLFGYVTALSVMERRNINKIILFTSIIFVIFAVVMIYFKHCTPIISSLWTSSYAMHASLIIMPLFCILLTLEQWKKLNLAFYPLRALGYNTLLIYLAVELLTKLMNKILQWTDISAEVNIYSYYYQEICYFYARQNEVIANIYYSLTLIGVILIPSLILYMLEKRMKI